MSLLRRLLLGYHCKRWASGQGDKATSTLFLQLQLSTVCLACCVVGTGMLCFHWWCSKECPPRKHGFHCFLAKARNANTYFWGPFPSATQDFLSEDSLLLSSLPFLCLWTLTISLPEKVFLSHYFLVLKVSWLLSRTVPAPCKHGWLFTLYGCHAAIYLLVCHGPPLWSSLAILLVFIHLMSKDLKLSCEAATLGNKSQPNTQPAFLGSVLLRRSGWRYGFTCMGTCLQERKKTRGFTALRTLHGLCSFWVLGPEEKTSLSSNKYSSQASPYLGIREMFLPSECLGLFSQSSWGRKRAGKSHKMEAPAYSHMLWPPRICLKCLHPFSVDMPAT